MAGGAQAASDELLTCERCHGFYSVEPPKDNDSKPRLRCNACGHAKELTEPPKKSEEVGKWTVIGPDGKVMTFGSWEELAHAQRPSQVVAAQKARDEAEVKEAREADKLPDLAKTAIQGGTSTVPSPTISAKTSHVPSSASALLDITPTPAMPKLTLAEGDSDPNLGDVVAKAKKALAAEAKTKTKSDAPPDSIEELDPTSMMEDYSDEEPAPLSLRDAEIISDAEDESHEMLSLKDLVVVPPSADDLEVDSTPPPPPKGRLHTLAPTPSKTTGAVAPPPTISWDEPPASRDEREKKAAAKAESKETRLPVPAKDKDDDKKTKSKDQDKDDKAAPAKAKSADKDKDKDKDRDKKGDDKKPASKSSSRDDAKKPAIASARAAVEEEPKPRGWLMPSLAIIAVSIVIWRIMVASPSKTDTPPAPPTPPTTAATTTTAPTDTTASTSSSATEPTTTSSAPPVTSANVPPTPTESALAINTAAPPASGTKPPRPVTTGSAEPGDKPVATAKPPSGEGMSMSELLDKAGAARRSGDYPTARELYERILRSNPTNVEANGGLGDVARATGDLATAKTHYERALASSPSYGPAQLGLADTEWDMGNRAGAQRRYAEIVARLGERAPPRAKERGTAPSE